MKTLTLIALLSALPATASSSSDDDQAIVVREAAFATQTGGVYATDDFGWHRLRLITRPEALVIPRAGVTDILFVDLVGCRRMNRAFDWATAHYELFRMGEARLGGVESGRALNLRYPSRTMAGLDLETRRLLDFATRHCPLSMYEQLQAILRSAEKGEPATPRLLAYGLGSMALEIDLVLRDDLRLRTVARGPARGNHNTINQEGA